jgi:hypothetical protein
LTELAKLRAYVRMGDAEAEREITAGLAIAGCAAYPVTVGNGDFSAIVYEMVQDVTSGEWYDSPARYGINTPMDERPYIRNRYGLGGDGT